MMQRVIAITLILLSTPAVADEAKPQPWYTVELILFEQPESHRSDSESWPPLHQAPKIEESIRLLPYQEPVA